MGTQSQSSEPNFLLVNRNSIFRRVETGLTAIAAGKFVVVADCFPDCRAISQRHPGSSPHAPEMMTRRRKVA